MAHKRTKSSKRASFAFPLILVGIGLIVVSIAIVVFSARQNPTNNQEESMEPVPARVNYPAPELSLSDLSGRSVSLSSLRGQVVLVNNWATWCPPCRAEMPVLEMYSQTHRRDGFVLVGINAGDSSQEVADFIKEYQLTFPMWLDPMSEALRAFNNNALPSSYVIDKTGTVRLVWMGAVTLGALETYVTPLLAD